MDLDAPLLAVERRRPGPVRVLVALLVTVGLMVVSVGYHDGLFWTDPLASASEPGPYRFKGVVSHYDPAAGSILLRDGAEERTLRWNISEPAVGRVYVVDAELLPDGGLDALALTRVLLFT